MKTRAILERVAVARHQLKSLIDSSRPSYMRDLLTEIESVLAPIPAPRASWWTKLVAGWRSYWSGQWRSGR